MATDYTSKLEQLLPPGKAWPIFLGSVARALHTALAKPFGRVVDRGVALVAEMDPRTCVETIDNWEFEYGLPDACAPAPTTLADRRAALTARVISRGGWTGGPSGPFLISLIVALGYAASDIYLRRGRFAPFTCESACTDPLFGPEWIFVWEFDVRSGTLDDVVVCQVSKRALSHLGLLFAFPLAFFSDGTFSRSGTTATFIDPITGNQTALGIDAMTELRIGV